jgi:predicted GNAT family acetyltransferase
LPTPPLGSDVHWTLTPNREDAIAVSHLLAPTYWHQRAETHRHSDTAAEADEAHARIDSHLHASAWVVAKAKDGTVIASARALSDGARLAWIYDVIVAADWRGKGIGDAIVRLLLDHPRVRRARTVRLATRDAAAFYQRMGFRETGQLPPRPYHSIEMVCVRDMSM